MAIILASKSPRRRELLAQMGLTDFQVIPAVGEETADPNLAPPELAEALALHKAREVARNHAAHGDLVIGADTIVVLDGKVLESPGTPPTLWRWLTALSGRRHHVYTGRGPAPGRSGTSRPRGHPGPLLPPDPGGDAPLHRHR